MSPRPTSPIPPVRGRRSRPAALLAGATTAAALLAGCGSESTDLPLEWSLRTRPRADSAAAPPASLPPAGTATATPTSLALTGRDTTVFLGTRLVVAAVVRDSAGRQLYDRPHVWASSDTAVLTVEGGGDVRALRAERAGEATVTVTLGALRQALRVVIVAPPPPPPTPVASVALVGDSVIAVGDSVLVRVQARDGRGQLMVVSDRTIWWHKDASSGVAVALGAPVGAADTTRATVRWVHGVAVGYARLGVAVDGQLASALFRVAPVAPTAAPRVDRIDLVVSPSALVVGSDALVTARAFDPLGQPVVGAELRLASASPAAGFVTQDSVGSGDRAGTVYGTLRALAPGAFSVTAETRDRTAFAQTPVVVTRAP